MDTIGSDYEYIQNRNRRIAHNEYLSNMVVKLNSDVWFRTTDISFSDYSLDNHFIDRFSDRNLDITVILPKFYRFILKHRCELIYYMNLENRPNRLEFEIGDIRIGLIAIGRIVRFRTIFETYKNRKQGRTESFVIIEGVHYYDQEI